MATRRLTRAPWAVGLQNEASAFGSLAFGHFNTASGFSSLAVGENLTVTGNNGLAFGSNSTVSAGGSVAVGAGNTVSGASGAAFGIGNTASGDFSTAFGQQVIASGLSSQAFGNNVSAESFAATAIGTNAFVEGQNALGIGSSVYALGDNATAIGNGDTIAAGENAIALGVGARANGLNSISIGTGNVVDGEGSGAIGDPTTITGAGSYSLGNDNTIDADDAGVFGSRNTLAAAADGSRILGNDNDIDVADAFVIGNGADVSVAGGVALGNGSVADTGAGVDGYNPITGVADGLDAGIAATQSTTGAVAVGDAGNGVYRQITGVAAGSEDSDAVNVAQLKASESHYYSVNDNGVIGGNYNNDGATGINAIATGVNAEASIDGSVALGSGSIANRNLAPSSGAIPAGSATVTYNTTDKELLGAISVGDSDSYRQITNVADGTQAQDAVTVRQLQGAIGSVVDTGIKYFHANSTQPDSAAVGQDSIAVGPSTVVNGDAGIGMGNGAIVGQTAPGGTAIGDGAEVMLADGMALGTSALSEAEQGIALGAGATVSHDQSVALGSNSVTSTPVGTTDITLAGTNYTFAGGTPTGTVSVGDVGNERTLTNVAAGRISASSTDAINGSQLFATNQAVEDAVATAGQGWELSAQGADTTNVAPGDAVDLTNADGNLVITKNATDGAQETVTFDLSDSVTIGNTTIDNTGIDMGGDTITNVGGPVDGGDAVNLDYFNENSAHYFSYNDGGTQQDNYANDGAEGVDSLAAGVAAATGAGAERAVALGYNTSATGVDSVAIGQYASAESGGSVAIGRDATANGGQAISIGYGNTATGDGAVSIGDPSTAIGDGALALGKDNYAEGTGAVAVGNNNTSEGDGALAIGDTNTATGNGSITMGVNNQATGDGAVALGNDNMVSGDGAFAVGNNATSGALDTLALGTQASATSQHAMALGNNSDASGYGAFAAGNTSVASGDGAMAVGQVATASGLRAAAIGLEAVASAEDALSVGTEAEASGLRSTAIGNYSIASGQGSSALGSNADAQAFGSMAIGARSTAMHEQSIALGGASQTVRGPQDDYVAYGLEAPQTSKGELAIGQVAVFDESGTQLTEPGERQITGVAAGSEDTDAVNVSQLKGIATHYYSVNDDGVIGGNYDNDGATGINAIASGVDAAATADGAVALGFGATAGNVDSVALGSNSVTAVPVGSADTTIAGTTYTFAGTAPIGTLSVGDVGNERTVTNVAAGRISASSTDAINGSQLFATNQAVEDAAATAGQGWDLTAQGADGTNVAPGDAVDLTNADGNLVITKNAADGAQETVTFDLSDSVTIGNTTIDNTGIDMGGDTITNLGAGTVGAGSTDAVNGSQLFDVADSVNTVIGGNAVVNPDGTITTSDIGGTGEDTVDDAIAAANTAANAGWNVTDGTNAANIGPNGDVTFTGDANIDVAQTGIDDAGAIEVTLNRDLDLDSVTTGNSTLDDGGLAVDDGSGNVTTVTDDGLTVAGGPSVTSSGGIDAGGQAITNVAAPVNGGDAINLGYFDENRAHYYSVNDNGVIGGNYNNDGATGINAIATGVNAEASIDGSVALGSGSIANRNLAPSSGAIPAGSATVTYNTTDKELLGAISVGDSDSYRQITNVADGILAQDAVTVRQLQGAIGSVTVTGTQYFHANSVQPDSAAVGQDSIAVGPTTVVDGDNGIGMGNGAIVDQIAPGGTAIGDGARVMLADGMALGTEALSEAAQGIALGAGATVSHDQSVALGSNSVTAEPVATPGTTIAGIDYDFAGIAPQSTVSIGDVGNERTLTNVAAGRLSETSTDAVNGSQLYATNQAVESASQGWDLSAQGADTTNVAPGDSVDLSNTDGNLVIAKNATDGAQEAVTFDLAEDVTIGSSLTVTDGPTIDGDGIDMGGDSITNVGAPTNGGDAVNLDYFNQNRSHYYSVNDGGTQGGNYDNDGATGVNAIAAGVDASASADGAMALGAGATAEDADSVALGANSATAPVEATSEVIINGETYLVAGTNPEGTVSMGDVDAERTATNVAAGRVSETSTDAVNGSQLYATNSAIDALGQEVEAGQVHYYSVNDAGIEGGNYDNDGATGVNAIAAGVDASATAEGSIAMGAGAMASEADSVAMGSGATTEAAVGTADITIGGQTYAFAGVSPIGTFSVGSAGAERTITHVAAGRVTADSTDAINGSQLYATNQAVGDVNQAVGDVEDRVTNVEGDVDNLDGRVTNVEGDVTQLGDRVSNVEGDVSSIGNDLAELDERAVKYDSEDGNVNYDSITLAGDSGTTISNVADGDVSEDSSDAVNGSQLWEMQEQLTTINEGGSKYFKANSEAAAARAEGAESVAMGPESVAQGDHSVAAGDGAVAESDGGVALGAGSQATREGMNGAEEAFSGESVASTQGAVSVGSEGGERQITNVAGGTEATDAVNVRQLEAVQAGSVGYDRNDDGSVDYGSVTLGQEGTPTQIHNVAAGELPTDAANVGQLQELNQQFNQQIGSLSHRIEDVEDQANAGTASAIAAASVPQAYLPGKSMVAVGAGTYSGESAVSVGVSRLSDNGRWAVKLNATGDSQSNFGAGVGVGFHW